MRTFLIPLIAVAALFMHPAESQAKDRGCGYRLASLSDARANFARALRTGVNIPFREAQLSRAKIKAAEEGCSLRPSVRSSFGKRRFIERRIAKRRFVEDRFAKRRFIEKRQAFRSGVRVGKARALARRRFDTLIVVDRRRGLSFAERRELRGLRDRWGF